MRRKYVYDYPRPMVTVDAVVFRRGLRGRFELLLIQRRHEPFSGCYALPGGFVEIDEDLPDAAARELAEETGLTGVRLHQLGAFGTPGRDPRGHNICVAFVGLCQQSNDHVTGGDDAADAAWHPLTKLPKLAFDHAEIIHAGKRWLRQINAARRV